MVEQAKSVDEPGAPIAKDRIDPDLVKLSRPRPKIGLVTAAGIVLLCGIFLLRLSPDRRFARSTSPARRVQVADVVAGHVPLDAYVSLEADPLISHAVRVTTSKGSLGLRVVPARGTGERLWIVVPGDGWSPPATRYEGRLRALSDLPFAGSIEAFAAHHPRPVFATPAAVRAGFATGKVETVTGEQVALAEGDQVAFDVVDPEVATVICVFDEKLPSAAAWQRALAAAQLVPSGPPKVVGDEARFEIRMPDAVHALRSRLEAASLWATRVEPVIHHDQTTWGVLRRSGPAGFTAGTATVPDARVDLVGLYVARGVPSGAYALLTGQHPQDYWYVMPVTVGLAAFGLLFAWALVRAIKRDLLPPAES